VSRRTLVMIWNSKIISLVLALAILASPQHSWSAAKCRTKVQSSISVEKLVNESNRPDMDQLLKVSKDQRSQFIKVHFDSNSSRGKVFDVMFEVVVESLSGWDGKQLIFLGRDSELIYDAALYILKSAGLDQSVQSRIRLVNLSRPVIDSSSYKQIESYLKNQAGVSLTDIAGGKQKFLIFDTGNRGSIYLRLLQLMLEQIPDGDKNWKSKVVNILTNIDFVLLATEQNPTLKDVVSQIKDMSEFDRHDISQLFDKYQGNLYFRQLDLPRSQKAKAIPKELYARFQWVVQNIEYQPHWEGRTLRLTQDGKTRVNNLEHDPRVNKYGYLARQLALLEHLEQSEAVQEYISSITKNKVVELKKVEKPKSTVATVEIKAGNLLKKGNQINLEDKVYEVLNELGDGKRGVVYKVRDEEGNEFALKIAKHDDAETLESFQRESEKQIAYAKAKVPYSKILAETPVWILKELVEGQRADDWINKWDLKKEPTGGVRMQALIKLFRDIANKGIYIGDMNPTNLIWSKDQWVIIDSGDATIPMDKTKAAKRFFEKNGAYQSKENRWNRYFPNDQKRKVFSEELEKGLKLSSLNIKGEFEFQSVS
jgi:RIO-like serine/threonine protein kinase